MELKEYNCAMMVNDNIFMKTVKAYSHLHGAKQFSLHIPGLKTKLARFTLNVKGAGGIVKVFLITLLEDNEILVEETNVV